MDAAIIDGFVICIHCVKNGVQAFSKSYFSGGVLSSQMSETTNKSLRRRLRAIANLCDFHNILCDVVFKWRSKKTGENHRCNKGKVEMVYPCAYN